MDARAAAKYTCLALVVAILCGCAAVPYVPGRNIEAPDTLKLAPGEPQIERGKPHEFLDGLGHYVLSLPGKIILWDWRVDNHNISPETEQKLRQYLAENQLRNVKVRLNQYAPGAEWRRLFRNRAIHPAWRYTLGVLSVASYTVLPGRAFGGDNYNPYTNTINLYSDHKGVALHEAGHAKDFARREWKGLYAFLYILPLVALHHEAVATGDAIGYDRAHGFANDEKADYKVLYPAYCTYIAGEGLRWAPVPVWVRYGVMAVAAVPGHIVGRIKASLAGERRQSPSPSPAATGK